MHFNVCLFFLLSDRTKSIKLAEGFELIAIFTVSGPHVLNSF